MWMQVLDVDADVDEDMDVDIVVDENSSPSTAMV